MGTRSLTRVYDDDGVELLCIYRQFDGYPEGMGKDLAEFLKDRVVVNGYGPDDTRLLANGMGCLAAQLVKHLKDDVGNVYIYPVGSRDCWEEYEYQIRGSESMALHLTAIDVSFTWNAERDEQGYLPRLTKTLYEGSPAGFLQWLSDSQASDEVEEEVA